MNGWMDGALQFLREEECEELGENIPNKVLIKIPATFVVHLLLPNI